MKSKSTMIVLATILSCGTALLAQVPQIVTYQGRLQAGGTNFSGPGQFKFAIVNQGTNLARQACATATVVSGFIVGCTVTGGGYGYTAVPAVTITDPTGLNAVGIAQISGGVVTNIYPQNAGTGYSGSPTVTLAPPPASMAYVTYWSHDGTSVNGGEPTTAVPVPVNQGLFAVGLGNVTFSNMSTLPASVFANPNPALRIWFSDGVGSVQQLTPDQAFTSAAYAMMAVTASNVSGTIPSTGLSGTYGGSVSLTNAGNSFSGNGSSLANLNASALTSGTLPSARLSGTYSSTVNFSSGANSLSGNGSGLTSLNANNITMGTVSDLRLSANVDMLNLSQIFTATKTFNLAPNFAAVAGVPFTVSSSTLVNGLNADLLDGYQASNATNSIPINNGTVNTGLNADMVDGVHGGNLAQIRASGVVTAGNTFSLAIPHHMIFTLQLSSGRGDGGIASVLGCENDGLLGVTCTKYNGDGTSAAGGSTTSVSTTNTVLQFGNRGHFYSYTVSCSADSGQHYLDLNASGNELLTV